MICIALSLACFSGIAMADDTNESWPEPVYFPQKPVEQGPTQAAAKPETKEKKGLLPFRRKQKTIEQKSRTDETIIKVGPKDPPPSPFPLLRLSMPILADTGIIAPGIYLVKPVGKTTSGGEEHSTPERKAIALTRQNKILAEITVHAVQKQDENLALTGTSSPITKVNPKAPPVLKAQAQVSTDLKSITITVQEGDYRFESDPFPVANDQRHILTF